MLKRYSYWILAFILLVLLSELALSALNRAQNQTAWNGIASLLRNEVNSSNSYQIARSLSDMEKIGWVKCVVLAEKTNEHRIFYDTSTQSYCGPFSGITAGDLQAINGSKWSLSFAVPNNIWLLALRVLVPIVLLLGEISVFQLVRRQQKIREGERLRAHLERALMVDKTKQTTHDLASPLGLLKIIGAQKEIPPELRQMISKVSERFENIFQDLKTIDQSSKLSDEQNLLFETINIDSTIRGIVTEKLHEWELSEAELSTDLHGTDIVGNKGALERVLSNLINNALEATSGKTDRRISIKTKVKSTLVSLDIKDNGCGIPDSILQKIGTKGFSYGKSDIKNSGLGVHHAISTIESFGGSLSIDSVDGEGTTISINLKKADKA